MDYIDLADGFFHYAISNYTGIHLNIQCVHEHFWRTSFMKRNGFTRYDQIYRFNS